MWNNSSLLTTVSAAEGDPHARAVSGTMQGTYFTFAPGIHITAAHIVLDPTASNSGFNHLGWSSPGPSGGAVFYPSGLSSSSELQTGTNYIRNSIVQTATSISDGTNPWDGITSAGQLAGDIAIIMNSSSGGASLTSLATLVDTADYGGLNLTVSTRLSSHSFTATNFAQISGDPDRYFSYTPSAEPVAGVASGSPLLANYKLENPINSSIFESTISFGVQSAKQGASTGYAVMFTPDELRLIGKAVKASGVDVETIPFLHFFGSIGGSSSLSNIKGSDWSAPTR